MKIIAGLLFALGHAAVDGGEGTPCPSDCWEWDSSLEECVLKTSNVCFLMNCPADKMELRFDGKLFGLGDNEADPFGTAGPQWDSTANRYSIDCDLGACNQVVTMDDVNNRLVFTYELSVDMEHIVVGDTSDEQNVYLAPVPSAIKFKCEYPTSVNVESDSFKVRGATATGEASKVGDLSSSFELNLYKDASFTTAVDASNLFIGEVAYARMAWTVTTAQATVNFYINECSVEQDGTGKKVSIIKDNCYSEALGTSQLQADKINDLESAFKFTSFTLGNAATIEMTAKMVCNVKMCLKSQTTCNLALSKSDTDCPATPGYQYAANTYSGV